MNIKINITCHDHDTGKINMRKLASGDDIEVIQFGGKIEIDFDGDIYIEEGNIVEFYYELLRLKLHIVCDDFEKFGILCIDWDEREGYILAVIKIGEKYEFTSAYTEFNIRSEYSKEDILKFIDDFGDVFKHSIMGKYGKNVYNAIIDGHMFYINRCKW